MAGGIGSPGILILIIGVVVVVGIVVVIVLVAKNAIGSGKKRCPYCAESIQATAQVCRFCGRPVPLQ